MIFYMMILACFCKHFICGITASQQQLPFSITQINKCLASNLIDIIRIFASISLENCVSKCAKRPDCQAINYRRRTKICELISSDDLNQVQNSVQIGPCILVVKEDLYQKEECSCVTGEVCENNACLKEECSLTVQPEYVEIVGNIKKIGADISYSCVPGYANLGHGSAECLPAGVWSQQPNCVAECMTPSTVSGAVESFSSVTESSIVTYSCIVGYVHTGGDLQLVCSAGQWTGVLPTCTIDCGTPSSVTSATRSFTSTVLNSVVTYSCQTGYTHTGGDLQRVCGSDGNWDGGLPTCTIDCETPSSVTGATRSFTSTVLNSVVTYSCQTGYTHTGGDLQRVCSSDGNWDGGLPTCTIDCGTPSSVTGATRSFTSTVLSSVVTYSCQTGYTNTGGHLQRVCDSEGNWGGLLPTCTVDCGLPISTARASNGYSATTEGSIVTYTCISGNIHIGGDIQRTCQHDGQWSGSLPDCVPGCSQLPTVPNSNVSPGGLTQGTQHTFTCTSGNYFATGVTSIVTTCLSGGVWSNMDVICPRDSDVESCPGCGILRDCEDVYTLGLKTTGTYMIYPTGNTGISVRCDMHTASGKWTIIQRRISSSDFYKTWTEYKHGFGDVETNYWLGNDNIATLTSSGNYKIRFELINKNNVPYHAEYSTFMIADESLKYRLTVSGYSGNAVDCFSQHSGYQFTTKDSDNDGDTSNNCAILFTGAWWFENCHFSNLNGMFGSIEFGKGIIWSSITGTVDSLLFTEMKIKRN